MEYGVDVFGLVSCRSPRVTSNCCRHKTPFSVYERGDVVLEFFLVVSLYLVVYSFGVPVPGFDPGVSLSCV